MATTQKLKLATMWLDGCSGCHMSMLDMDERLIEIAQHVDVVCSPYVDIKELPEGIDLAVVEGAVSSEEDLHKVQVLRARSKLLVSLGDCAVAGNVPSMRNFYSIDDLMTRAYNETTDKHVHDPRIDWQEGTVPLLRPHATPVHTVVPVDVYVPGCPPPADAIYYVLMELVQGRVPQVNELTRFGK